MERLSTLCCDVCSLPVLSADIKLCHNCVDRKLHFVAAMSAFRYQGLTRELVARYKYGADQSLQPLLQYLIVKALEDERLHNIDFVAVVPVPLHSLRERERGFHQVLPLAQSIAQTLKLPLHQLLKRSSPTSFQAGSNRQQRLKNLEGAFILRRPLTLKGNYLLVDDVLTTGATLSECARILCEAGAEQVWAVTLAR